MGDNVRIQAEAAAFRGLVKHLQKRTDVQNIDLMNLSGFCRNCLSKWYMAAMKDLDNEIDYDAARKEIYGMDFNQWKEKYQKRASDEQMDMFEKTKPQHAVISGHK